jgi:alkylated DNA repair dioxygenase AlkB
MIPGLRYVANVLSLEGEQDLIAAIDSGSNWSSVLRRRVQHYGYRYNYRTRSIDETMRATPFPDWLATLAEKLMRSSVLSFRADQAIVNEYLPGQGIARHVDCEPCFGPEVGSLSLGSGCEMQFSHIASKRNADPVDGQRDGGDAGGGVAHGLGAAHAAAIYLERRSAVVLRGAARYEWDHGIPARLSDNRDGKKEMRSRRVSITFRTVILNP